MKKNIQFALTIFAGLLIMAINGMSESMAQGNMNHEKINLSSEAIRKSGIVIETAGPVIIRTIHKFTGKVALNVDRVAHVVPRLTGVVREVRKKLGDQVKKGEVIALLDSRELADAKSEYIEAVYRLDLAEAELKRGKIIFNNTVRMLELLKQEPDLNTLHNKLKGLQIGENRVKLIPVYANLKLSKRAYLREKGLYEKKISTESEYLNVLNNYEHAEAAYITAFEEILFQSEWSLQQNKRSARDAQIHGKTVSQKLMALGLSRREIKSLLTEKKQVFTKYELKAPFTGTIIKKEITVGEAVKEYDTLFTIADLTTVWVDVTVYANDLNIVKKGQKVVVKSESLQREIGSTLTYIGTIMGEETRAAVARIIIPNPQGYWRPGLFVTVELILEETTVPLAVSVDAVQTLGGLSAVFIQAADSFEMRPLKLGRSDGRYMEVLQGLSHGEKYVTKNSFILKAEWQNKGGGN